MSKKLVTVRNEEINETIEAMLSQDDIDSFREGEMTDHVQGIVEKFGLSELQIWGGGDKEPLEVVTVKFQ